MSRKRNVESELHLSPQEILLTQIKFSLKCKNEKQKEFIRLINNKEITISAGPAGTGKTYVACAEALKLLTTHPHLYKKIVIVKSVTVLEGEDVGFLKGTLKEKMEPVIASFLDNFEKLIGRELTAGLQTAELIQVLPVAYVRGRTIDNSIIIIDEAQNLNRHHLISIITRIGENSKMIFLGDTDQIDIKDRSKSAFRWLIKTFSNFPEFGTIEFTEDDSVRNPIISKILNHIKIAEETIQK